MVPQGFGGLFGSGPQTPPAPGARVQFTFWFAVLDTCALNVGLLCPNSSGGGGFGLIVTWICCCIGMIVIWTAFETTVGSASGTAVTETVAGFGIVAGAM